ncbi:uncharacterized protein LOC127543443 [Antechinus flavipes]|uniref:uncharacterized protein LOC127543443 n=1 Tax=Antechinus flavipes TaxID=38775 RepID=UPI002236AE19|nr:uncharacterized protein LOC127543443 [Antechinus flavipes]
MSLTRPDSERVKAVSFPASSAGSLARAQGCGGEDGDAGAGPSSSALSPRGAAAGVERRRRRRRRLCCPPSRARVSVGAAASASTSTSAASTSASASTSAAATRKKRPLTTGRRARQSEPVPAQSYSDSDSDEFEDPDAPGTSSGRPPLRPRVRPPLTLLRFPGPQAQVSIEFRDQFEDWDPLNEFCPGNFLCASPKSVCVHAYVSTRAALLHHTA